MCAVAKSENKYIREFIEHYKKYDVDKIYIYDNNDLDFEPVEEVINDYIKRVFVELIDYRGYLQPQTKAYIDCYERHKKENDWLIFYDLDEYIHLKDIKSVKTFLNDEKFEKCEKVQLNWVFHTDNNQLYYEDKPLRERFPEADADFRTKVRTERREIKSAIRGNLTDIDMFCPHVLSKKLKSCNGFGKKEPPVFDADHTDYEYYYIEHYACKSTEEFINNKLKRTDAYYKKDINMEKIQLYFSYNKITKEKLELIENRTKYNLSEYRKKKIIKSFCKYNKK